MVQMARAIAVRGLWAPMADRPLTQMSHSVKSLFIARDCQEGCDRDYLLVHEKHRVLSVLSILPCSFQPQWRIGPLCAIRSPLIRLPDDPVHFVLPCCWRFSGFSL